MHITLLMPGTFPPVGASLLAKAVSHSALLVTDRPLSRAGSLGLVFSRWNFLWLQWLL